MSTSEIKCLECDFLVTHEEIEPAWQLCRNHALITKHSRFQISAALNMTTIQITIKNTS
jgi:hypothetical protein